MEADEQIDKCSNCKHAITSEEYITILEDRGEYNCKEEIITGYKCNCCGNTEEY